jgi:hypothetical protein
MLRPGIMAPPTLYDEPAKPGLFSPGPASPPFEVSLRAVLWSVAVVLAVVELGVQLTA